MDFNAKAMESKIVEIQFESRLNPGTFAGKEYSYIADIPVNVGDIVKAPTRNGVGTALVRRVDVPITEIQCRVGELRHITEASTTATLFASAI